MSYTFPEGLHALRNWLVAAGVDAREIKTERQAAFFAQKLAKTRLQFPAKGASCFIMLRQIQNVVTAGQGMVADASVLGTLGEGDRGERPPKKQGGARGAQRSVRHTHTPRASRSVGGSYHTNTKGNCHHGNTSGLVVYADGAAIPNPGPGGWGFVAYLDGREIHAACGGSEATTNNQMEMTGALHALHWIAQNSPHPAPRLLCDSQYVVKGCNEWRQGWKAKGWRRGGANAQDRNAVIANLDLWKDLDEVLTAHPLTLEWVKGHAGVTGNERADELADEGMRAANKASFATKTEDEPIDLIREQLGEFV